MSLEASAHRVELPALSKETIAGGLLVNGRKVIGLTKTERYHLRVAIEELVANGHNLNDILHVCETTREFYFCQIDTIRELPPGNKNQPDSAAAKEKKTEPDKKRMTYEEKLKAIDQVDHLRYVIGMELREACQKTSISLHKYYKLTLNRKAIVDAIRRGLGQTADEPKRKRRMRIPDHTDHKDRMTYVERTRKRLQEGANLGDLLARDGIPVRLYFKWAGEAEQAAAAQEQADGNGEGESPVFVAWKAFGRNKHDQKARNVLMAHYLPMVRTIGEKISVTLPRFIDVNDLVQEGVFGLDDALNGFDPGRGKSFRHYATTRIWGSMMDYLREQDWVPRVERQQYNHVRDAAREAYLKDGHGPDQQPDAEQPALAESNGNGHPLSLPLPRMISMSNPVHSGPRADKPQPLGDTLTDESTENSGSKLGKQEFMRFVLTGCNTTERLVMILYYYEEMTMKEIGEALDVSESRVSQIHSTVVERQRAVLHDRLSAY